MIAQTTHGLRNGAAISQQRKRADVPGQQSTKPLRWRASSGLFVLHISKDQYQKLKRSKQPRLYHPSTSRKPNFVKTEYTSCHGVRTLQNRRMRWHRPGGHKMPKVQMGDPRKSGGAAQEVVVPMRYAFAHQRRWGKGKCATILEWSATNRGARIRCDDSHLAGNGDDNLHGRHSSSGQR